MNIAYSEKDLLRKATYKDFRKTLVAISIAGVLFVLLFFSAGGPFSIYFTSNSAPSSNDVTIPRAPQSLEFGSDIMSTYSPNSNVHYILFFFILSIVISVALGVIESLASRYKFKSLSQIITSNYLTIKILDDESSEILMFIIENGILEVHWHTNHGSVQNWKIMLTLYIPKIIDSIALTRLPEFLLMNEVDDVNGSHPNDKIYQKTIFIREWVREDYIIHFWLKTLTNNHKDTM